MLWYFLIIWITWIAWINIVINFYIIFFIMTNIIFIILKVWGDIAIIIYFCNICWKVKTEIWLWIKNFFFRFTILGNFANIIWSIFTLNISEKRFIYFFIIRIIFFFLGENSCFTWKRIIIYRIYNTFIRAYR